MLRSSTNPENACTSLLVSMLMLLNTVILGALELRLAFRLCTGGTALLACFMLCAEFAWVMTTAIVAMACLLIRNVCCKAVL